MPRDLQTPLTLTTSGDIAEVTQDDLQDRRQRIAAIINTPAEIVDANGTTIIPGTLDDAPQFGRTFGELAMNGVDPEQVTSDIQRAEPDLAFNVVQLTPSLDVPVTDNIRIDVPEDPNG